jgi:hypothetical protein
LYKGKEVETTVNEDDGCDEEEEVVYNDDVVNDDNEVVGEMEEDITDVNLEAAAIVEGNEDNLSAERFLVFSTFLMHLCSSI